MKNTLIFLICCCYAAMAFAQSLPNTINISSSPNGVVALPSTVSAAWANNGFVKYTKITAPNGQAIHFVAQNQLTDAQIVRSRNILAFYLSNLSGAEYGADKAAVANKMAENEAILLLLNGADGEGNEPNLPGQYLFEDEIAVEGHAWYNNNNFEHRDAAFEEILHLMHDTGIGVDGPNSWPGALPNYQAEIRAAQINAGNNNFAIWPIGANGSDPGVQSWYNELDDENSLSQEYLASVIDSYYGLWGPWTETPGGMWGIYTAKTRADITTDDPMGLAIIEKYFAPFITVNMDIDPSFNGIFSMAFDAAQPYTHKSQYLQHCTLTGSNTSGLKGNDEYNRLIGNDADNTLEGSKGNDRLIGNDGNDTAVFTGTYNEYTINNVSPLTIVSDNVSNRDGIDTLENMEVLQFMDQNVELSTISTGQTIAAQVFLEGAYIDDATMSALLSTNNLLPNSQPFNTTPWMYEGTESASSIPSNVTDWVLIEVRNTNTPSQIVEQHAAFVQTDGVLIDMDGSSNITFNNLAENTDYHLIIRSRNHLAIASANFINLPQTTPYNFTDVNNILGSNGQVKIMSGGYAAMIAGDFNSDGIISVYDFNYYTLDSSNVNQYLDSDCNLDGSVTVADFNYYVPNSSAIGVTLIRY